MNQVKFVPHSEKQEQAIFSKKPILLLGCGTQFGKTVVGAVRMMIAMHTFTDKKDAFIITAPNYKIMIQSTLPAFLGFMRGKGRYNGKEDVFEMFGGGRCYMRTETLPDSIVGITSVRHIWGDEAGKYRRYFWENMQARSEFLGAPITLTTSPYALNWVFKDIIKPYKAGLRPDVEFIQAASWENPYHSLADPIKRQEARYRMDERRFSAVYGGNWERMEGLVYDCWDDNIHTVPVQELPLGTEVYAGIDWGYNPDPFAVVIIAVTPHGMIYGIGEVVKTRLTITDIKALCLQLKGVYKIKHFFCDPSNPANIEELNRGPHSCSASGADNTIRLGIDIVYEMIKSGQYREFKDTCPNLADEREQYHYPEFIDLKPDQGSKEQLPVDKANHSLDAWRYVIRSTYRRARDRITPHVNLEVKPKPRFETVNEKLDRLKKFKHDKHHSEKWSS